MTKSKKNQAVKNQAKNSQQKGNQAKSSQPKGNQIVKNLKAKDNGAKLIFDDPILCAQFLRGYVDILYLIAIVEHQSKVHYDMSFRLLRYIVMILTDYEKEQEMLCPGITKTKDFKYPPILPIVYYEGTEKWTAVRNFKDRVHLSDALGKYIPSFEYLVVPLTSYSNQDLVEKGDELSLIFLINKLRSSEEFRNLKEIPQEYFDNLEKNTPDYLLKLIGKIIAVLLYRMNVPRKEVEEFTDQITRREFDMLFDSFEAYDVQETRRISREEGREEGEQRKLIQLICKKLEKNVAVSEIADMLEEDVETIQEISNVASKYAPEYDIDKIMAELSCE